MSLPSSPSPSSASDDFAALLDAELQSDHHSTSSDASPEGNVRSDREEEGAEVESGSEELDASESEDGDDEESGLEDGAVGTSEELELEGALNTEGEPIEFLATGGDALQELRDGGRKRKREVGMDEGQPGSSDGRQAEGGNGSCPPHPGFMWGVCIRCGQHKSSKPSNDPVEAGVSLRYIHEGLEVTEMEAARMRRDELKRVTAKQKLYLVVDLDHTVLNSVRFVEVPPEEESYLMATYFASSSEVATGEEQGRQSSLHRLPRLQMFTKLRPFVHEFLEEASKMFEMYVYTMGERIYALAMAQLLDPTGRLFGDRVISQVDSTRRNTKDLDVVLGAESAVVILDDTEGVWPKHRENLILMERYHFFTSSCRQFGVKSPSLAEAHRDESESEGSLATALHTLRRVHRGFFHANLAPGGKRRPPAASDTHDVRQVIRGMREKILAGCRIVFSRIFPTGLPSPNSHPFWQLTEDLGAQCSTACNESTTHIVALDQGTDKARWAKQHGRYLVHPSWVEAAQYLWRRPTEEDFPVTEDASGCPVPSFAKSIKVEVGTPSPRNENGEAGASHDCGGNKNLEWAKSSDESSPFSDSIPLENVGSDSRDAVLTNGVNNNRLHQKDQGIG